VRGGAEDGVGVKVRACEQAGDGDLALGEEVVRVGAAGEEVAEGVEARVGEVAEGVRVGGELRRRGHGRTVARAGRDVNPVAAADLDRSWVVTDSSDLAAAFNSLARVGRPGPAAYGDATS
jgi:hypothetical protein